MKQTLYLIARVIAICLILVSCGGGGDISNPVETPDPTATALGELIFNDQSLSASGRLACASCHSEGKGHADPTGTILPMGGANLDQQGIRSSLSLSYLETNSAFSLINGFASGGFTWDGRFDSREQQASSPLLNATEMANASVADLVKKLRNTDYFPSFQRVFSIDPMATDQTIFENAQKALAIYQTTDPRFSLFNSKFDSVLDGDATFTEQESRGLLVFNDQNRGNCVSCHLSAIGPEGQRPIFTSFAYFALGLPRNQAISANTDPNFFDMGLCGPKRADLTGRIDLCGMFKVPTLRNIALTGPYFHNAAVGTLEDAVAFYATRDSDPARWYPLLGGVPDKFNDLPPVARPNVVKFAPFGLVGGNPRLNAQDVEDLVAFLRTLTDDVNGSARSPFVGK